jgi:hypothetical protein
MKKFIAVFGSLLFVVTLYAQMKLEGKYNLVQGHFETVSGKYIQFVQEEYDREPCLAKVVFTFTANGNILTSADNCPDSTKKKLFGPELAVKWVRTAENKIIISTKDDYIDPMTFDLKVYLHHVSGKKMMTWETNLEVDPNDPNPDKAKKLLYVYRAL